MQMKIFFGIIYILATISGGWVVNYYFYDWWFAWLPYIIFVGIVGSMFFTDSKNAKKIFLYLSLPVFYILLLALGMGLGAGTPPKWFMVAYSVVFFAVPVLILYLIHRVNKSK